MYIVNTSFMVDATVQNRWLELVTGKYIPFLKEQGFLQTSFYRVISAETPDHFTYSLQVTLDDLTRYQELTQTHFNEYRTIADELFGAQVMWFHSLLKQIEY